MSDPNDISNHSGPGSAAEPSMEEILASIRRILKEDEGQMAAADGDEDEDDDVLVLDASMVAAPADISTATQLPVDTGLIAAHDAAPVTTYHEPMHFASEPEIETQAYGLAPEPVAPEPVMATELPELHPEPAPVPYFEESTAAPELHATQWAGEHDKETSMEDQLQPPDGLVGDNVSHAINSSIGALISSISTDRAVSITRGGLTIEDIVREEIRPVLKAWFDTHLPSLVERIVRAEIGRVIDRTQI
jgi:cell pole-organizing protein PopZ